ncbi:hypothetical protein AMTRI_Chr01g132140 [Amborella trichopoda]|uniref:uncharacterized protein LOC18437510 n=1 Tax=Amborella trichopoda TaxID=13333 RepID=UPI0005D45D5C|nr:uncharacterized protein LOC18437510 [Amborella trichopoda]XP_011624607.1 uncharacterized protein LOC18437510 [Amborella trichopoda]XP_020524873.1 uncharacterized protein LOC18437510 [Amborella trichopoda]XP_020524875.1 uncharacterized protein LOC18437510 [Amborella trichopoda]|eukprot:XP_011624606.1 uncharacterized protein LOC18437510 [Amborella trichopoda]
MESTVPVSGDTSNSNVRALSNVEAIDDSGENEHLHANNEVEHSQEDRNDKMGKNSPGNATIDCEVRRNMEPFEGMVFESEEAVRAFYNEYARQMGFGIRIYGNRRAKNGQNVSQYYVCSRQGHRGKKYLMSENPRPHTREGCKARIYAKRVESGQWVIKKFFKEHSHAMVSPSNVVLLRSHRRAANRAKNLNFIGAFDKELENQVENKSRECNMQEQDDNSHEPLTLRYIDLRDHALKVVAEGATTAESYRFAMRGIQKLLQDVIANKLRTFTQNGGVQGDNTYKVSQPASINENVTLGDPQHTNKTGCPPTTNLNLGWENASKKRKTCVNCKQQGHDKRTCSRWTSNNAVAVPMSAIPEHELDPSSTVAFGGFQRFGFGA